MPEYFNPHSRKGSDLFLTDWLTVTIYFNPHSRKGSDRCIAILSCILLISIHTPARGVTVLQVAEAAHGLLISIHTPARGVTFKEL